MFFIVMAMLLVCIGIPLAYSWRVLRLNEPTKASWLLLVAEAAVLVALVLLVGRWDMAGYYTRFLVLALFLAAVLWSLKRHMRLPWTARGQAVMRQHWTTVASLVFFGGALCYVAYGFVPPKNHRELAFPFDEGRFMVAQGGGISLLNHHAAHPEQRYAVDITAINDLGYRAAGLAPKDLDRYVIYGVPAVSPCSGEVVAARSDLPDLVPPDSDAGNPRGNHVIVDCGEFNVELAHLQPDSVVVSAGDLVAAGDVIGKAGNTGNTTEPHLHVHAVNPETNSGVPMSFQGRLPTRNEIYGADPTL